MTNATAVSDASNGADRRLRILCLHGHASNNDITELQAASLQLELYGATIDFFHGPYETAPGPGLAAFSSGPFYTWGSGEKFQRSLDSVFAYAENNGPFDGSYHGMSVIGAAWEMRPDRGEITERSQSALKVALDWVANI